MSDNGLHAQSVKPENGKMENSKAGESGQHQVPGDAGVRGELLRLCRQFATLAGDGRHSDCCDKNGPVGRTQAKAVQQKPNQQKTSGNSQSWLLKANLERAARDILDQTQRSDAFLGWLMVVLASEIWREQITKVPMSRRLLLLPPISDLSSGDLMANQVATDGWNHIYQTAKDLGYQITVTVDSAVIMQSIMSRQVDAVLGVVGLDILERAFDRILATGVPCMAVPLLELDRVDWPSQHSQRSGREIPFSAENSASGFDANKGVLPENIDLKENGPLGNGAFGGKVLAEHGTHENENLRTPQQRIDVQRVLEMLNTPFVDGASDGEKNGASDKESSLAADEAAGAIHLDRGAANLGPPSYLHLMRSASELFEPKTLEALSPRTRGHGQSQFSSAGLPHGLTLAEWSKSGFDAISATESIAYEFLTQGGKHSRPFITLAVYDAMTGGAATQANGQQVISRWSAAIKRIAMSIEVFHKASLVHDDIEDNDDFRYGQPAMHKRLGVATAINVGDYLVGMGYRLVSRNSGELEGQTIADILDHLAQAHQRLSEGQGAELIWRDGSDKRLSSEQALQVYALKTSPAFEVAFYSGLRLAGPVDALLDAMRSFSRSIGIAFQILNDLQDWREDETNKGSAGGDVLGGRPTVLWSLALESLGPVDNQRLMSLIQENALNPAEKIAEVRQLYGKAKVFEQAFALVDHFEQEARSIAGQVHPPALRNLMQFMIDFVLKRSPK